MQNRHLGRHPAGGFPTSRARFVAADLARAVRRVKAANQRELAELCGLSRATIVRIEAGAVQPRVDQVQAILAVVGWRLGVWDPTGRLGAALADVVHPLRDGADRHYPAHLELIVDPQRG